jgi:hypothetical protein
MVSLRRSVSDCGNLKIDSSRKIRDRHTSPSEVRDDMIKACASGGGFIIDFDPWSGFLPIA